MPSSNFLRRLARRTPSPLDGVVEYGAGALTDIVEIVKGLPDDPTDTWDPEHIRRTLPWLKAINAAYFRPEVRGLENIPVGEPSLLVGNHSGGLMIADTFVLSAAFYDHFGPDRRFHQLAHDVAAKSPLMGLIRRYGVVPASHDNARAAFKLGAPVLVYPGGDLPLHGAEALREARKLVEPEADEGAGLVVLARESCHGSMYLRFG